MKHSIVLMATLAAVFVLSSCSEKCADCIKHTDTTGPAGSASSQTEPFEICGEDNIKNAEEHKTIISNEPSGTYTSTEYCTCVEN